MPLQLELQSQYVGNVAILRCRGRIVAGDEIRVLQSELEKITKETKNVILQLEEVSYLDSSGLGSIVRCLGMLRAARGDLKLCRVSPFISKVLQATNLHSVFEAHDSESEALKAFTAKLAASPAQPRPAGRKVLCVDTSSDLLAYLNVLLHGSGYEIFTTRILADAVTLLKATRPDVVVLGPAIHADERAIEMLRQIDSKVQIVPLPSDFSTSEASQAGVTLVERIRALQERQA